MSTKTFLVSLCAALVAGVFAASAFAYPVTVNGVTYCRQNLPNGGSVDYSEGTVITVHHPDGTTAQYKCVNGQWIRQSRTILGSILAPVNLDGSYYEVTAVQCAYGVAVCSFVNYPTLIKS
jgi:hypothetical protein